MAWSKEIPSWIYIGIRATSTLKKTTPRVIAPPSYVRCSPYTCSLSGQDLVMYKPGLGVILPFHRPRTSFFAPSCPHGVITLCIIDSQRSQKTPRIAPCSYRSPLTRVHNTVLRDVPDLISPGWLISSASSKCSTYFFRIFLAHVRYISHLGSPHVQLGGGLG
jgi:hypothetical protein